MTLLNETEIGMAGQSTVLGDATGEAIKLFENTDTDNRVLIVLTDGNIIAFFKFFKKEREQTMEAIKVMTKPCVSG